MIERGDESTSGFVIFFSALALGGCSTVEIKPSNDPDVVFQPRPVETIGETIAREQQGEDGCLVAGNLNKGKRCRNLTELLTPPAPSTDPRL